MSKSLNFANFFGFLIKTLKNLGTKFKTIKY